MTEAIEQAPHGASDAMLIAAVRRGETRAYGVLYERHLAAAKRAASCLANTAAEREDLVAEAFTRVLQILRTGRGPAEEFRPYLLVTMRHLAINAARRAPVTALFADLPEAFLHAPNEDPVVARLHGNDAASAFARLPERWRVVLWHTEIEGESPADIAPQLGMTPNGVAALAYRAREGLRLAYLRQHLPTVDSAECRATTAKLAGWVRRSISAPQQRKVGAHLARCPRCRELANGLTALNGELRAILAPIVLGAPFAAAYLKASVVATATASSGVASTVSWLTAMKASVSVAAAQAGAAAAIAAVTAVTVVASDPGLGSPADTEGGRATAQGPAGPVQRPAAQPAVGAPALAADTPRPQGTVTPSGSLLSKPIPAKKAKTPPPPKSAKKSAAAPAQPASGEANRKAGPKHAAKPGAPNWTPNVPKSQNGPKHAAGKPGGR